MATKPKPNQRQVVPIKSKPPAVARPSREELIKRYAGHGVNTDASENLIPMLRVLQGQSPQVLKKNEAYIQGAEAGDIILMNAPDPLIKADEGFLFQPCYYHYEWVLWRPRKSGGGLIGRFDGDDRHPPNTAQQMQDENGKWVWRDSDSNDFVFTRYFTGYVLREQPQAYAIPFSSTGHTVARAWNTAINQIIIPESEPPVRAPIYGATWRIKTRHRSNAEGDWYVLDPQLETIYDPVDDYTELERGRLLCSKGESKDMKLVEERDDEQQTVDRSTM